MKPEISIIIPVYNEKENIQILYSELDHVLKNFNVGAQFIKPVEIIWIDDGSTDGSDEEIKKIISSDSRNRLIKFTKNFGQTSAIAAGISHATGNYIVTIDADLQNDPSDIPVLYGKIKEGFDVVSGWRKNRQDNFLTKTIPSILANFLISKITGIKLHDYGCTLKIYKSELLKSIKLYGEMHRFLPALLGYIGANIHEIEVHHRHRKYGKSKYGLFRTFKVILDLLTVQFMGNFLSKPIYLFGGVGMSLGIISVLLALITLYKKIYQGIFVKDQPLFLVAIFFALVGIQLLLMGLIAEILVRTYYETNKKPAYSIREKINF